MALSELESAKFADYVSRQKTIILVKRFAIRPKTLKRKWQAFKETESGMFNSSDIWHENSV